MFPDRYVITMLPQTNLHKMVKLRIYRQTVKRIQATELYKNLERLFGTKIECMHATHYLLPNNHVGGYIVLNFPNWSSVLILFSPSIRFVRTKKIHALTPTMKRN